MHHLGDGVGSEDLVDGVGLDGDDAFAFGDEHGGDVGEVELAVGVVGGEGVEFGEEGGGFEAVDAGVDSRGRRAGRGVRDFCSTMAVTSGLSGIARRTRP